MRAVFMGRKAAALDALDLLIERGWDLLVVVPESLEPAWSTKPDFRAGITSRGFSIVEQSDVLRFLHSDNSDQHLEEFFAQPLDLIISYLFPERVQPLLLDLPKIAAINFHPAPLPDYGGMAGYNLALLEGQDYYGVTAHIMDDCFDSGPIIEMRRFNIGEKVKTAYDLERSTRPELLALFADVIAKIDETGSPGNLQEQSDPRYITGRELDGMKRIDLQSESGESLSKKVRAFWYPPYDGAFIELGGKRFTLVDQSILQDLGLRIHKER